MINKDDIEAFKEIPAVSEMKVSEKRTQSSGKHTAGLRPSVSETARPETGSLRGASIPVVEVGQQFAGMNKGVPYHPDNPFRGDPAWMVSRLQAALSTYDAQRHQIGGCHDRFCVITGRRTGVVTNGGCNCGTRLSAVHKLAFKTEDFRASIEQVIKDFDA
jgi:hypothetical protein